jgi:hypothetical protein
MNKYFENKETPFCRTCFNAGLTKEEYTSHWTRKSIDPNSEIICPLILEAICSYCKEKGHWKKYCPVLANFSYKPRTFQKREMEFSWRKGPIVERPPSPDYPPPTEEKE